MNNRNELPIEASRLNRRYSDPTLACELNDRMKSMLAASLIMLALILALATISRAAELPDAPSAAFRGTHSMIVAAAPAPVPQTADRTPKVVDKKFAALAIISTGSAFADSYTTLFARENYLAGKRGVCNEEVESAYLYGTHPTVARAYAVASVKSAGSVLAAYYLRKHHSKFWSLPLLSNSAISLQGVTQNMLVCN